MNRTHKNFTDPLIQWYEKHGRKNLPWQHPRNAYRVWLSEIMLQQTQVKTVIPYFERFITCFPDLSALANATEDEVLAQWSGLGYYSRARNLHKTAQIIHTHFQDEFPQALDQLIALPGIGPSTAAAIASLAFEKPTAILDGNVQRVLSRYFLVDGLISQAQVKQTLWQLANECMPETQCAKYTQAIMDMGATCCTLKNPDCLSCPLQSTCLAYQKDEVQNYPQKKPKVTRQTKQQLFILLHTSSQLLYLEKRPPTGIWGGLWCLPSINAHENPEIHVRETYKLDTQTIRPLLQFKHSFSHYHLQISSVAIESTVSSYAVAEYPGRWFTINELTTLGLSKPIRSIIDYFLEQKFIP